MLFLLFALLSVTAAQRYQTFRAPPAPQRCQFRLGVWGACSVSCGTGDQSRFNEISTPGLPGCPQVVERRSCFNAPCHQPYGQVQRVEPEQPFVNPYPVDCSKKDDGLVPNPLEQCSKVFYSCANGRTFENKCPGKLYYDFELRKCESWSYVPACSGHGRPATTPAPYATPAPPTYAPELDCKSRENGAYSDPLEKCSHRYFACSNGVTSEMQCNAGLYFDEKTRGCERFVKVYACTGQEYVEPIVDQLLDHKEPEPVPIDCLTLEDGDYSDPENQCSERFFTCTNKIGYEKWCPGNTFFDEELGVCNLFSDIPICSGKPRPQRQPEGVPTHVIMVAILGADLHHGYGVDVAQLKIALAKALLVDPYQITEIESPDSRSIRFTARYSILASVAQLAKGYKQLSLYFNGLSIPILKMDVIRTITGEQQQAEPRPVYPYSCETNEDGNYAAEQCADYYWACIGGTTERMVCPPNTKYDEEIDQCELDEFVPGCGGYRRTPPPPLAPAVEPLPLPFDCEKKEDGRYTLESCTSTYYTCSNGEAFEGTCPEKTVFDVEAQKCDIRAKVTACGGGRSYGAPAPIPRAPVVPRPRYGAPAAPVQRIPQLLPAPRPRQYGSPARVAPRPAAPRQFAPRFRPVQKVAPQRFAPQPVARPRLGGYQ